jgi:hypothetical protein
VCSPCPTHDAQIVFPTPQACASALYAALYHEFSSPAKRQETVAALVAHCGAPAAREVDCALAVLAGIAAEESRAEDTERRRRVKAHFSSKPTVPSAGNSNSNSSSGGPATLRTFSAFLKSLLVEDLRSLDERQLRVLFTVIFQCSCVVKKDHDADRARTTTSSSSSSSGMGVGGGGKENRHGNGATRAAGTGAVAVGPRWVLLPPDDVMILLKKCSASTELKVRSSQLPVACGRVEKTPHVRSLLLRTT